MKFLSRSQRIMTLVLVVAPLTAISGDAEDQAVKAAEEWLDLVDQGEYEASWEEAAALFRSVTVSATVLLVDQDLYGLYAENICGNLF